MSVTGAGAVNLGSAVTAASVLGSSALSAITIGLTGLDFVGNVTTGLGADVLSISSAVRNNSANYTIATGTGADTLTLSIVQGFTWDGGGDYDTLRVSGSLDLTGKTVSMTSVDEIYLDVGSAGAGTLTISSTTFNTNPIFNLRGTTGGADTLIVQGLVAADTVNANLVSVESSFAALRINGLAGNDTLTGSAWADTLDGGTGIDTLSGGTGNDTFAFSTGLVGGETITITDFDHVSQADKIDLSSILSNLGANAPADKSSITMLTSALNLGGALNTVTTAISMWDDGTDTYVYVTIDNNDVWQSNADLVIKLVGVTGSTERPVLGDFVLTPPPGV